MDIHGYVWLLLWLIITYFCTVPMWMAKTKYAKILSHDAEALELMIRENNHLHAEIMRLNHWLDCADRIPDALDAKKQSVERELENISNSIVRYANMLMHGAFTRDVLQIRLEMARRSRDAARDKVLAEQGDGIQLEYKCRRALMPPVRHSSNRQEK